MKISLKLSLFVLILLILLAGIWGTWNLVRNEFSHQDICPKLLGIPACYIIMACFLLAFASHVFNLNLWIYFIPVGIALGIASYGSLGELFSFAECPKTERGTPMCYLSFMFFFGLTLLKILEVRIKA